MNIAELNFRFVRSAAKGSVTKDGREFPHPYKKRINAYSHALTEGFINALSDAIDDLHEDKNLRLLLQSMVLGGAYQTLPTNSQRALPHRNSTCFVVFDVFYVGDAGKTSAEAMQQRVTNILNEHSVAGDRIRLWWGSYGDTDLNNVWQYYYGTQATYDRARCIKRKYDEGNLFATPFNTPVGPKELCDAMPLHELPRHEEL